MQELQLLGGGFAEYVFVLEWNLIGLPGDVSFAEAAMFEPMAIAVHAMRRMEGHWNDTVVVYGLGTMGTLLVMVLMDAEIHNILVVGNKTHLNGIFVFKR